MCARVVTFFLDLSETSGRFKQATELPRQTFGTFELRLEPALHFDLHSGAHIPISQRLFWRYAGDRPAEEPFGGLWRHVEAAMTVRVAVIIVPVCTVERDATFCNIQHPRYTGQIKAIRGDIASSHVPCGTFMVGNEISNWRSISPA